eukprot:3456812-Rhodomonas_salina.1
MSLCRGTLKPPLSLPRPPPFRASQPARHARGRQGARGERDRGVTAVEEGGREREGEAEEAWQASMRAHVTAGQG